MTRRDELPLHQRAALKVPEVALLLGIGRTKAYELVAKGVIPSVQLDGMVRVPRRALEAWLDEQTRRAG